MFIKHEDFRDHKLHCVQKWVIVIIEVSETHQFEDSECKEDRVDAVVKSDAHETPIHATTIEVINALLADGYKVNDDRLPDPDNTPSNTVKTDQPVYKEGLKWNILDHRRAS